jgi:hypothetical protein
MGVVFKRCAACGEMKSIGKSKSRCKSCRKNGTTLGLFASPAIGKPPYPLVTIAGFVYQVIPDANWIDGCWKFDADPKIRHIKRSWVTQECLMGDEA